MRLFIQKFIFPAAFFICLTMLACQGMAEQAKSAASAANTEAAPDRIIRPMMAVDPVTLRAEGMTIRLWGIKPAHAVDTPLELSAMDLLDSLISHDEVNCKVMGGAVPEVIARCTVSTTNRDLGLELLGSGYAVVERAQTYDTPFASAYAEAQEIARLGEKGVWRLVMQNGETSVMPKWLKPYLEVLIPVALVVGPFGGLLIVAMVMYFWLRKMTLSQQNEMEQARRKEVVLQTRERHVLVATLEGELVENKNKVEAFLIIYGDMLRGLKDGGEAPKYQQVGDIIQKNPSMSRAVFEANVNKLSLLDIKLAGSVSKLYASFPKDQEYVNLDTNVPIETAVKLVEKVLKEAADLIPPLDQVIQGLQAATAKK